MIYCNDADNTKGLDYYPYGKILREFQNGLGAEKYLTTHHERDKETGLDYRGARYYDADVARMLSLDPSAESYAEWTPYVYVGDNPVKFIDPDGKDWLDAVVGTLVGAATNVVPGTTALRNFYKPNDASTYNNTLRNTDNAFTVLGVGLTIGGTDIAAAGGTATATVAGAPVGVPAAGVGIAVAGTGVLMTTNATINKANGYNYDGSGSSNSPSSSNQRNKPKETGTPNSSEIQNKDASGKTTRYTTYDKKGKIVKEVRSDSGSPRHGTTGATKKIPKYNTNPNTGKKYQNGYEIKPATKKETPPGQN